MLAMAASTISDWNEKTGNKEQEVTMSTTAPPEAGGLDCDNYRHFEVWTVSPCGLCGCVAAGLTGECVALTAKTITSE